MAELAESYAVRARQTGRQTGITSLNLIDFAESRRPSASQRTDEEAENLLAAVPAGSFIIALDERGKSLSSNEFARIVQKKLESGTQGIAFLIGGPDGHGQPVHDNAGLLLSFGKMTWPHMLARVLLVEQVYRAVTILVNHPYHRE